MLVCPRKFSLCFNRCMKWCNDHWKYLKEFYMINTEKQLHNFLFYMIQEPWLFSNGVHFCLTYPQLISTKNESKNSNRLKIFTTSSYSIMTFCPQEYTLASFHLSAPPKSYCRQIYPSITYLQKDQWSV